MSEERRNSGGLGVVLIIVILAGFVVFGQEFVIVAVILGAAWVAYRVFRPGSHSSRERTPNYSQPSVSNAHAIYVAVGAPRPDRMELQNDPRRAWIHGGGNATVQGRRIGGMIYLGRRLAALDGYNVEPALIDPTLPAVSQQLDLSERRTQYWPSYSTCSPEARGAYLQWLSSGRSDPNTDIGLIFLYFYGLERRALADPLSVDVPAAEIEAIRAEVLRLLGIYGNGSFQGYAQRLLDVLEVKSLPSELYRGPPPSRSDLGLRQKVGLAQCAKDGAPLPADWAISWLESDTTARLPIAARRCKSEFRRLFAIRYRETCGEGLLLPRNKTKLRFDYHPASASFHGWRRSLAYDFDLPDVTVLSSPVKKLRAIAEGCCEELGGYSRRLARAGIDANGLECIAELPYALWPEKYRNQVERIRSLVTASGQPLAVSFESVQKWMPSHSALAKSQWRSFVGRLAEAGIGVEPDPGVGGSTPTADTRVAFFALGTERREDKTSARYRAAALTVQLAVAVASVDGAPQDLDRSALTGQLEEWLHLTPIEKARLNAHLRRVLSEAPKITGLKSQIRTMDRAARKAVGAFVVSVAQSDGVVSKGERKMLERIFKLLELDPTGVPSATSEEPRVIVTAGAPEAVHPIRSAAPAFVLDPARVRHLQAETERVATLLTGIFNDEEATSEPVPHISDEAVEHEAPVPGLWGLDAEHSDLARKLLGRAHWTRAELGELAEDREIMLDGALEMINEACLDATGQALLEGSDPVEVNRDLARTEQAA